jgi:inner membrane protein
LLAANAPDIDIISALGGSLTYLHYHRHITHTLVALPVLPLLCLAFVRLVGRKPLNWLGAYFIGCIGVASHLILDLTNIYGVRLLLPFSGHWFRWDTTSVIDFWIWAALLLAVLAPMLARLVNAEIGASTGKTGGAYRAFAIAGLAFLALYDGGRYILHERALATLDARIYGGNAARRVAAFPTGSMVRWRGLAETADAVVFVDVDLTGEFNPSTGRVFYKPEPVPAFEAARRTQVFQEFLRFSQFPFWQAMPADQPPNAIRVEAMDLRFGDPQQPGFVATAIVDAQLHVDRAWFQFGSAKPR